MASRKTIPQPVRVMNISEGGANSGSTTITHPFTTTLSSSNVIIYPGTVNQLLPSNMFATFTLGAGNPHYLLLNVGSDGKSVNSLSLSCTSTALSPPLIPNTSGSAPSSFKILLAVIVGASPSWTVYQIGLGNVVAIPKQIIMTPKASVTPGVEPFDRWWTWVVVQRAV